jgi:hypothetical protein
MKIIRTYVPLFSLLLFSYAALAGAGVKLSTSGICHAPNSPWYDKTTRFTSYATLSECISAGGRLPKGVKASNGEAAPLAFHNSNQAKIPKYNRRQFGDGWSDADGDCQNSRAEALVSTSTIPVRLTKNDCRVLSGRWISPFTGNVIMDASGIDIDHVVPLAWAWAHGAHGWSRDLREKFGNDPINLWPVEASLNRQKGAKGPNQWLPPSGQCQYVARFKRIVLIYRLELSHSESTWINTFLTDC